MDFLKRIIFCHLKIETSTFWFNFLDQTVQITISYFITSIPTQATKQNKQKTLSLFPFWIFSMLFINRKPFTDVIPFQIWTSNVFYLPCKGSMQKKKKERKEKSISSVLMLSLVLPLPLKRLTTHPTSTIE